MKKWLVMADRTTNKIIAQFDDTREGCIAAYKKAEEQKEWVVWTKEQYEKEFLNPQPPKKPKAQDE